MYCKKCGNLIQPTDAFCNKCGEPVSAPSEQVMGNVAEPQAAQPSEATPIIPVTAPVPETPVAPAPVVEPVPIEPVQQPLMANANVGNVQQPVAPNVPTENAQQPAPEAPKSNKTFIIIVIILLAIIAVIGGVLLYKKFFSAPKNGVEVVDNGGGNNVVDNINNDANLFAYGYYKFPIPDNYLASIGEDGALYLKNNIDKVMNVVLLYQGYNLDAVKEELDSVRQNATDYEFGQMTEETYEGIDWIILDFVYNEAGKTYNGYAGYAYLGRYIVSENAIYNVGGASKEKIFTDFSKMYKNAIYTGTRDFSSDDKEENAISFPTTGFDESMLD